MILNRSAVVSIALILAACSPGGDKAVGPTTPLSPAANIINANLDLEGTPDLIVRQDMLLQQYVIRDENLPANYCSVVEGGVTPGVRRIIRFTVMTPNVGDADLYIGDPNAYVDAAGNSDLYEFSTCHGHYHFKHYATYELLDANTGKVWKAAKRGFCMLDTDPNPAWFGEPPRDQNFMSCGYPGIAGFQGISHGWTDTYRFTLGGQYFVLDGGDGQPVVPPGDYFIRITVNPSYAAPKKGGCPRATDPSGLCHNFWESNYSNNVAIAKVSIPAHVGRAGVGPLSGSAVETEVPEGFGK
ncbi:MAG: lysyl oxidase family protein [Gemmatimonadota bacterium]|nr:lysyl oxidase family protein [Gemmatimonadota bacterium]